MNKKIDVVNIVLCVVALCNFAAGLHHLYLFCDLGLSSLPAVVYWDCLNGGVGESTRASVNFSP